MSSPRLVWASAVPLALCLGLACDRPAAVRSLDCPSSDRVTRIADVHYEGADCESAVASAESHLAAAYYRKACEQLAPREGVPARVSDAYVTRCAPAAAAQGGSILDIEVCCP